MDNERFQDLMLEHLGEILNKLNSMESNLTEVKSEIKKMKTELSEVKQSQVRMETEFSKKGTMKIDMKAVRADRKRHAVSSTVEVDISASIRAAAREARNRYNPDNDPVLQDFKKKMRKIRMGS